MGVDFAALHCLNKGKRVLLRIWTASQHRINGRIFKQVWVAVVLSSDFASLKKKKASNIYELSQSNQKKGATTLKRDVLSDYVEQNTS